MGDNLKMKQSGKMKAVIFWCITVLWIGMILYLSSQNGEQTARTSLGLAEQIAKMIYQAPSPEQVNIVHGALRKLAHVTLFFVLGILSYTASRITFRVWNLERKRMAVLIAVTITSAYGFLDEWHKQFIVGRHFDIGETMLNIVCGLAGVGVVLAMVKWKKV